MSNILVFEEEGDEMDDDELASCSLPVVPASSLSQRQTLKAEERDDESQPAQSAPALFAQNMNIESEQQQPQDAAAAAEAEAAEEYKNEQEEQPEEEAVAAAQATRFGCTGGTIAKSRFDDEQDDEGESAAATQVPQPPPDFRGIDLGECDESDDDDSSSDDSQVEDEYDEDDDEFDDDIIEMSHEVLPEPQEDDDDDGLSAASDESEDFAKDWDWNAMSADEAAASASTDTDSEHPIKQESLSKKRPRRNARRACRVKEEEAQEKTKKNASFRSYKVTPKKQKTSNGDDGAAASTTHHHHRNDEYCCDNAKCYGATCTWKKYTCSRCNKSYHKRCCILYELPKTAIEQLGQPWTCYDCRPLCECGCGEKLPWENMKGTKHPGIIHCSRCDKCFRTSCITISARNHRMCNTCAGTKYPAKKEDKPAEQPAEVSNIDEMEDIPAE